MSVHEQISKFENSLISMGRSCSIFWLFQENCFITLETIYLKWDSQISVVENQIQPIYESAKERGLPVEWQCISEFNGLSLCFPWVPMDQKEADQCMIPKEGKRVALNRPYRICYHFNPALYKLKTLFLKSAPIMKTIPKKHLLGGLTKP